MLANWLEISPDYFKMRTLSFFLLLCLSQFSFGQKATRVWQATGLSFPHGFHSISTPEGIFFNAYHSNAGFQLYRLDGENLKKVTSFKQALKKKEIPEAFQGAQTSNYEWFNDRLYFFALGKGVETGIYSYDGHKVRLIFACQRMSNGFAREGNKTLATHVGVKQGDSTRYFHLKIDSYLKINRVKLKQRGICSELVWFNGTYYGTFQGVLGTLKMYPTRVDFRPVPYGESTLDYVSDLTVTQDHVCFFAQRMYGPVLGYVNTQGENRLHVLPGKRSGMTITVHRDNNMPGNQAYFIVHDQDSSHFMRWDGKTAPVVLKAFPASTEITGSGVSLKQHVFSLSNGGKANLFQVNGNSILEQKIRYIDNPNYVVSHKDILVYLAKERNKEYLYTSIPLMPPLVTNSSYSVFDFWPNGRNVGQVLAKSVNKGRLRYNMVSGNEGDVFRVNEYSGEIEVSDHAQLKSSGQNIYHLGIEVVERKGGSSLAMIDILVKYARPFSKDNLRETLMFFPDFSRARTLTTTKLPDGETVMVYDFDFKMVDMLEVNNSTIVLGAYTPGMYILNVKNKENLYQKIELQ